MLAAKTTMNKPVIGLSMLLAAILVGVVIATKPSPAATAEQLKRCDADGLRFYNSWRERFMKPPGSDEEYQIHYNARMGKCLVLVSTVMHWGAGAKNEDTNSTLLFDANKIDGNGDHWAYAWWKTYPSGDTLTCNLSPSFDEWHYCKGWEEFSRYVDRYMTE